MKIYRVWYKEQNKQIQSGFKTQEFGKTNHSKNVINCNIQRFKIRWGCKRKRNIIRVGLTRAIYIYMFNKKELR